jgi:hypothetical protein
MTPQSNIMVVAPILENREAELRLLLEEMNFAPGTADPQNPIVPFGKFPTIHYARFVILEDRTREDLRLYNATPLPATKQLAFLCDCDGPADDLRKELATHAREGLKKVFSCCQSFGAETDLLQWMVAHEKAPATAYVNWVGRTVQQVREEQSLRLALEARLQSGSLAGMNAQSVWNSLRQFADGEREQGRLTLTPAAPTPLGWQLKNLAHLVAVPLLLLIALPLLLIYLPLFLIQLRVREKRDAEIVPRTDPEFVASLAVREDLLITNQFSAYGNVKPGLFRRWTLVFLLFAIEYTTRHIYNRGYLARVSTIHFARWVFLDDRRRLYFASNYDGSLESYMGDFINKVAFGLNLVFSNGVGYPRTNWLVADGAKDEQKFKDYIRRHQLPTEVWYDATPGVTAYDMARNQLIREGLEKSALTDAEAAEWLKLL